MKATHRVLVVDDDPVVGISFDRVLTGKGYAVISAASGDEALARLAAEDYDMVYTDIKMPGMSGLELARRIKASRPWLPVVIVTGYGTEANETEARALGTSDFLRKPLSPELIEDSLERAIAGPEAVTREPAPAPAQAAREPITALQFAKNVGLFIAAPLVGLAYIVVFPFVGLGLIAWMGVKSLTRGEKAR